MFKRTPPILNFLMLTGSALGAAIPWNAADAQFVVSEGSVTNNLNAINGQSGNITINAISGSTIAIIGNNSYGAVTIANGTQLTTIRDPGAPINNTGNNLFILGAGVGTGVGEMTITSGGRFINDNGGYLRIGNNGTGKITVSGEGSYVNAGRTSLGGHSSVNGGDGTLIVEDGAKAEFTSSWLVVGTGADGGLGGGKGLVVVDGISENEVASTLTSTGVFTVAEGKNATGTVRVQNGGVLNTTNNNNIGLGSGASANFLVTGTGSAWNANNTINIAAGSNSPGSKASITVADFGQIKTPTIQISDTNQTGRLNIGGVVDNNGVVSAPVAPGILVGNVAGSSPLIVLGAGASSLNLNHTAPVSSPYTLGSVIAGTNALAQVNIHNGFTMLKGANTYAGLTTISEGAGLVAGGNNTISSQSNYVNYGILNVGAYTNQINALSNYGTLRIDVSNTSNLTVTTAPQLDASTSELLIDMQDGTGTTTAVFTVPDIVLAGQLNVVNLTETAQSTPPTSSTQVASYGSSQVLIHAQNPMGMTGSFSQVKVNGNSIGQNVASQDYLYRGYRTGIVNGVDYTLFEGSNLRWNVQDADYTGIFTLAPSQTFTLDTDALADQIGTFTNWDGRSLIKEGRGTLAITHTQSYTGDTTVRAGTLDWGLVDSINVGDPVTQRLGGNYNTLAGATTALSQGTTFLEVDGNFKIAGDGCNVSISNCFDLSNPLGSVGEVPQRGVLSLVANGGEIAPEILVHGTADVQGAVLNIVGLVSKQPHEIIHATDLGTSAATYTLIHADQGFIGADPHGGSNATAGFANGGNPVTGLDYLGGGATNIVTCDAGLGAGNPCLYTDANEIAGQTQEYILSDLQLSWTFGGQSGVGNSSFLTKNGTFTIATGNAFDVDVSLDNQNLGTDLDPSGSGQLGFNSLYGWWDGQTLTKKGEGVLYLSAANTYTGSTHIQQGTLSVADASHLGNTQAVYLGHLGSTSGATLQFAPSPTNSLGGTLAGLNTGTTATFDKNLYLSHRADNTIEVTRAGDTVTLTGSIAANLQENSTASTSVIKTGQGTLVLAPNASQSLTYTGDTWVQSGRLVFQGETAGIVGDLYNQSELEFNVAALSATIFNGNIYNTPPSSQMSALITPIATLKTGAGVLYITGDTFAPWDVAAGELAVAGASFNGDVTLAANTILSFVNPQATPITQAAYSGTLSGHSTSLVYLDRPQGSLDFYYTVGSTVGMLEVRNGNLNLLQGNTVGMPMTRLEIGSLDISPNAAVSLLGTQTYLNVQGPMTMQGGSTVQIALNPSQPTISNIQTDSLDIGAGANLNILGFATPVNFDASTQNLDQVFKASQLSGFNYLVVDSQTPINGEFANQPDGVRLANPDYLVYDASYQNGHTEFHISNLALAWTGGGATYGTGSFHVSPGTGINIDVPLVNQTVPVGGFVSGWDGQSLTKQGAGLLILSNNNNSYTGATTIQDGSLVTSVDHVLRSSSEVAVEQGVLDIHNTTQSIQRLRGGSKGQVTLGDNGQLLIENQDTLNNEQTSSFAGSIMGGNSSLTSPSTVTVNAGTLELLGEVRVDQLVVNNAAQVSFEGANSENTFRNFNLNDSAGASLNDHANLQAIVTGGALSSMQLSQNAVWSLGGDSTLGKLGVNNSLVNFGDPLTSTRGAGTTLKVGTWNGDDARLNLFVDLDSYNRARLDTLVITQRGTGSSHVELLDRGGFQTLLDLGQKILPIQSENGVGIIDETAFDGGISYGTKRYSLVYDTETGGFMIDREATTTANEYKVMQSLLRGVTQGSSAHSVSSLGNLSDTLSTTSQTCGTHFVFGNVWGVDGKKQGAENTQSDTQQVNTLLGGDVYGVSLDSGCLRYGLLAGYSRTSDNVRGDGGLVGDQFLGKNTIGSYYVGGYAHYQNQDGWYSTASTMLYQDTLKTRPQYTEETQFDANAMAASLEVGTHVPLSTDWSVQPSAQLMYQTTRIDDIQSNQMLVKFDNIDSMFGRLGVKAEYTIEDGIDVFAKANMWHQFKGESVISAYRPKTGQLVNSTMDKYTNNTWADLQLGLSMQYESTELFGGIGYIGNFGRDNAVTGRVGLNYRW